jgi:hypothetical protein
MNTDNSSQSNPSLPDHYDVLTHPLVHFREPPSFSNCLDILHNCCYLADLFGSLELEYETDEGLSEQASTAFFWQTRTLESTLRYVSLCLRDVQNGQMEHLSNIKDSPVALALKDTNKQFRDSVSSALLCHKDVTAKDIDLFAELLKG